MLVSGPGFGSCHSFGMALGLRGYGMCQKGVVFQVAVRGLSLTELSDGGVNNQRSSCRVGEGHWR